MDIYFLFRICRKLFSLQSSISICCKWKYNKCEKYSTI